MTASHQGLTCPQCGGSLPRQALWRAVNCPYCKAAVTLNPRWVERAEFRAAWQRAHARGNGEWVTLRGADYRLLRHLARGEHTDAWLAERHGSARLRAVIKLAQADMAPDLAHEVDTLRHLHSLSAAGSTYYSLRIPQPLAHGLTTDGRAALAVRAWPGFWGSLADLLAVAPNGISDARHAVWLWRRVLELLDYLHGQGWCHCDLRPEHWLIHPADHGVHFVGWGRAATGADPGVDLQQSAWAVRAALAGLDDRPTLPARCPPALARLLQRASEDRDWCHSQGAAGLAKELSAAALADFGPPRFVPFDPHHA